MISYEKLIRIKPIPWVIRIINPKYSHCTKCGLPWNKCRLKSVSYSEKGGTFAVCRYCWERSSLKQLKLYYKKVYFKQTYEMKKYNYQMDHSLEDLLNGVEKEYYSTRSIKDIRKEKLNNIKSIKK